MNVQPLDTATVEEMPASRKTLDRLRALVAAREMADEQIPATMVQAYDEGASLADLRDILDTPARPIRSRQTVLNMITAARARLNSKPE